MTALTLYGVGVASGTLATAATFTTATGGTGTTNSSTIGTATGYGEIVQLGTTNAFGAFGSLQSPTDNGTLWDVTTLEGQTLAGGTFTAKFNLTTVGASSTITADIICRLYKRSSGGVYTSIGNLTLTGQTINTTTAAFSPTGSLSSMAFATGDKLYMDLCLNVTANANGLSGLKVKTQMTSTAGLGLAGATELDTSGFAATPANHKIICDGSGGLFS